MWLVGLVVLELDIVGSIALDFLFLHIRRILVSRSFGIICLRLWVSRITCRALPRILSLRLLWLYGHDQFLCFWRELRG